MRHDAFTLIELLVVIAIIAVVSAIMLVSYSGALSKSEERTAQLHANGVRMALDTTLATNPQLNTSMLGTLDCTQAADITPSGLTAPGGGNGWEAAPSGMNCTATPLTSRTYSVTVNYSQGTVTYP